MNTINRVWIELERDSDPEVCHARAAAASQMLAKLGLSFGDYVAVWFDEKKGKYAFTQSSAGTFVWATDHGYWFNLDRLSA
jgi:hypothetical protein